MDQDDNDMDIGYVPDDPDESSQGRQDLPAHPVEPSPTPESTPGQDRPGEPRSGDPAGDPDEYKDKYLRTLAEMDNFRKRMKKEKEDFQKYVFSDFLLDLLPILDNLERALKSRSGEAEKGIAGGVEIIRRQFVDHLKKYRVVEIDALGKEFDPAFHQALAREESAKVSAPTVIEVYQKGYLYHDRLLRPVLAKVAIPVERDTVIEKDE
jgi:molecular chaperone GrpE